eukprot:m.76741 g.76741  ORF g.76741 m.76741 type:complete len:163 (-) comp11895_c0_seq2:1224-1712(-)
MLKSLFLLPINIISTVAVPTFMGIRLGVLHTRHGGICTRMTFSMEQHQLPRTGFLEASQPTGEKFLVCVRRLYLISFMCFTILQFLYDIRVCEGVGNTMSRIFPRAGAYGARLWNYQLAEREDAILSMADYQERLEARGIESEGVTTRFCRYKPDLCYQQMV